MTNQEILDTLAENECKLFYAYCADIEGGARSRKASLDCICKRYRLPQLNQPPAPEVTRAEREKDEQHEI